MVGAFLARFRKDERGISFTEGLLIMPIVLAILTMMVEAGVAVFQWNQATKAVQIGARLAAVSSPIVGDTAYDALEADWVTLNEGDPVPGTVLSVSCGPGAAPCDSGRIARLLTGSDTSCDPTITNLGDVIGMCDVANFIGVNNVLVTYYRSGLGYQGRPGGAVSSITVELRNVSFDFLLLDSIANHLAGSNTMSRTFNIPAQPVSFVSEDLCDTDSPSC